MPGDQKYQHPEIQAGSEGAGDSGGEQLARILHGTGMSSWRANRRRRYGERALLGHVRAVEAILDAAEGAGVR